MKVFIWFLFFLPIVYAAENYDYFQLVLQWPPTVCSGTCTPPVPLNFTIHGLWPSNSREYEPPECHGSPFNRSAIQTLIPQLEIYWPNLTGDNLDFWGNQWNTSGTCSEGRFNESEYFSKALELKKKDDFLGYLDVGRIKPLPSNVVYRSCKISDVIEHGTGGRFNGTGHKPRLWCKDDELLEISVCYDVNLANIMDCPPQLLNNPRNKCNGCVGYYPYPDPHHHHPPPPPPASSESY